MATAGLGSVELQQANTCGRSERVVNANRGTGLLKLLICAKTAFQFHLAVLCVKNSAFAEGIVHTHLKAFVVFVGRDVGAVSRTFAHGCPHIGVATKWHAYSDKGVIHRFGTHRHFAVVDADLGHTQVVACRQGGEFILVRCTGRCDIVISFLNF